MIRAPVAIEWQSPTRVKSKTQRINETTGRPARVANVSANRSDLYAVSREALSRIPQAVAIIGAANGPDRSCATGTAMYVSFVPPMVVIAEHPGSRTCKLIEKSGAFSVSLLHGSQQDIAERAGHSADGSDKFITLKINPLEAPDAAGGAPGVAGSIAVLWCAVRDARETGDHIVFTGEVVAHHVDPASVDALLRFRRRYAHIGEETSVEAPEGYPT